MQGSTQGANAAQPRTYTYTYVRYMRDGTTEQRTGIVRSRRKVRSTR